MTLSTTSSSSGTAWTPALDALLHGLKQRAGIDFSGYSRASLTRRIEARMQKVGLADVDAYAGYCGDVPDEYSGLAQTILIRVTSFFRDPAVWEAVQAQVVPRLQGRDAARVWCARCASGEEAYTLAMVLAEAWGRETLAERVRIEGTDINDKPLDGARQGLYSGRAVEAVPPRLRDKYFERAGDRWEVCPALRRAVRFHRHDLMQDAPLREIDLLACRNTMMYFDAAGQTRVLGALARALVPGGGLLLGRAEGILPHIEGFAPWNRPMRLFYRQGNETIPSG